MSTQIDVSFFIPVYQPNLLWLDEAVNSICRMFARNHLSCELLLGDDGSPTPVDLKRYEMQHPESVRIWRFPENRGIGRTSCALAELCRGRYIASFDQDDILLPFDLDQEIAFLDSHPEFCASYATKFLFNSRGFTGDVHGNIDAPFLSFFQPKVNINAMLIRRESLFSHGSFKPLPYSKTHQDVWLMMRLMEDGLFYFSREPRALYRVHEKQNSNKDDDWDWSLIGQSILCRHPEEYQDLLFSQKPKMEEDPKKKRLRQQLAGLAFYMNQKSSGVLRKMLDYGLVNMPEDPGVWEMMLELDSYVKNTEHFSKVLSCALEQFQGNPDARLIFLEQWYAFHSASKNWDPGLLQELRALFHAQKDPPPMARQVLEEVMAAEKGMSAENSVGEHGAGGKQSHATYSFVSRKI